jgi:hypothetical protein
MRTQAMRASGLALASLIALPAIVAAQLPIRHYTPGATSKVDVKRLCSAEFATSVKPIAKWQREEALTRYGIRPDGYSGDVERLIPVSLGGSNDPDNLFPFHASGEYTVAAMNQLADHLHQLVCDGKVALKDAQDAFKKDWTRAYKQYLPSLTAPGQ